MQKVASFAVYLAQGFDCPSLVGITTTNPEQSQILRADSLLSPWLSRLSSNEPVHAACVAPVASEVLARSIVVCQLESGSPHTEALLPQLGHLLDHAPAGILLTAPDARIARPRDLQQFLADRRLNASFAGWTSEDEPTRSRRTMIAVLENNHRPPRHLQPTGFRIVALMPTYNEADIISHSLRYLISQGIDVYVVDNWSTDGTVERAQEFLGKGLIGLERFPASGPLETYEWRRILGRLESLAECIETDWFMLHDADERRHSPWPDMNLKAAVYYVDRCGFNCIDHVVLNYWPTTNWFDPTQDVERQLRHYTFSDHPGHFHQRKIWKNPRCGVSFAPSAGHDVCFPGRLVYPFKFLLKHYPIRSQSHGERKVFGERAPRWSQQERSLGWHKQYDGVTPGDTFIRDPATLQVDDPTFDENYLIERLSGIGVFAEAPPWATGPRQPFGDTPQLASRS